MISANSALVPHWDSRNCGICGDLDTLRDWVEESNRSDSFVFFDALPHPTLGTVSAYRCRSCGHRVNLRAAPVSLDPVEEQIFRAQLYPPAAREPDEGADFDDEVTAEWDDEPTAVERPRPMSRIRRYTGRRTGRIFDNRR